MIKRLFLLIAVCVSFNIKAQNPNLLWSKFETGNAIVKKVLDYNNNIYVAGILNTTLDVDFGPGTYTLAPIAGNGTYDFYIAKYDPAGNFLMAKGVDAQASPSSLAVDKFGNITLTGTYFVNGDFDPGPGVNTPLTAGYQSCFVVKYNSQFNFKWAHVLNVDLQIGSTHTPPHTTKIVTDSIACGVYVCGDFVERIPIDGSNVNIAGNDSHHSGNVLCFMVKFDSTGATQFYKVPTFYPAISVTSNGQTMAFYPNQGQICLATQYLASTAPQYGLLFDFYALNGTSMSTRNIQPNTTPTTTTTFLDIKSLNIYNGHLVFSGHMRGTYDFDPSPTTTMTVASTVPTKNDMFFAAYSLTWVNKYVKKMSSAGTPIATLSSGECDSKKNLLLSSRLQAGNTVDYDPNATSLSFNTTAPACAVLHQYDSLGNLNWAFKYDPGTSVTNVIDVKYDKVNNIIVTGIANTTVDIDPNAGVTNIPGTSNFFAKYSNPNGATAGFLPINTNICAGQCINFTDISSNSPSSWTWSFPGSSTPTSNVQNPVVCYPIAGTYTVTLITSGTPNSTVTSWVVVKPLPTQPTTISGLTTVCAGSANVYSVAPVSGATSYSWTLPGGWTGSSTTNSISITAGATSNTINVAANNACGSSIVQTLSITVSPIPSTPSAISGSISICNGTANSYSVAVVPFATAYFWGLPGGWSGSSTTNNINTTASATSGTVSVFASNACGNSSAQTLSVTVKPLPTITVNSGAICPGQSFTMSPSGASTFTFSSGSAVVSPTTSSSYSVTGTSSLGCVSSVAAVSNVTVNTNPTISVNSGGICIGQNFTMSPSGASTYTFSSGSAVVTPTINSSYSVTGTSAAGCTAVAQAISNVTVNSLPTISVNSGSICSGQNFTMSPSGASTYTFSSGSAIVSPVTTTSYTVNGSSAQGCAAASPAVSNVTVSPSPTVAVASTTTQLCIGQSATLTASGAITYSWLPSGSGTSIVVSPVVNTTYTLTGADAIGCPNTTIFTQNVINCTITGLNVLQNSSAEILIYPNPFNNKINVVASVNENMEIYSSIGALILSATLQSNQVEIDLTNQADGIYFIRIGSVIKKVVKE